MMLSYVFEYKGVRINDPSMFDLRTNQAYASIKGVDGFSGNDLRHTSVSLVDQHGTIDYTSFMQGRLVTIKGGVVGRGETECIAMCNSLGQATQIPFSPSSRLDGYNKLRFWHPSTPGTVYFVNAKPNKLINFSKKMHIHRLREFEIQFRVEDQFIYSDVENESTYGNGVGDRVSVVKTSLGRSTAPVLKAKITNSSSYATFLYAKISGPFSNVKITNKANGKYQKISGVSCDVGEYIEVESKTAYAYKNGSEEIYTKISGDSSWITIEPGENDIEFEFSTLGGYFGSAGRPTVQIKYRGIFLVLP